MRAARLFATDLKNSRVIAQVDRVQTQLYGSLALTGKGHCTDIAIMLGLLGEKPESVEPDGIGDHVQQIRSLKRLPLLGSHPIAFDEAQDIQFLRRERLAYHPNGMRLTAYAGSDVLREQVYYSIGGGFVLTEQQAAEGQTAPERSPVPHPFQSASDLLNLCLHHHCPFSQIVMINEQTWRSEPDIRAGIMELWSVMQACVERGCNSEGILPGGLRVQRRAAAIRRSLTSRPESSLRDPLSILDWVDLYALAVNEENAAGGRVVTAPTNGAAGIIPAVLHYYHRFVPGAGDEGIIRFFLTAGAIGMLYKMNASISGAEVGCQGEVGVACSMAAGALTEVMGGSVHQVEQAAEIGMEHNLGLTCDPIRGLVQIPCIERNAMGAVKAINASRLALRGDGEHRVSLDKVIATMRRTGADMSNKYKETSRGGLAVNVTEC
jgi:L-serine dehydratase